jgi:hypothetical protein
MAPSAGATLKYWECRRAKYIKTSMDTQICVPKYAMMIPKYTEWINHVHTYVCRANRPQVGGPHPHSAQTHATESTLSQHKFGKAGVKKRTHSPCAYIRRRGGQIGGGLRKRNIPKDEERKIATAMVVNRGGGYACLAPTGFFSVASVVGHLLAFRSILDEDESSFLTLERKISVTRTPPKRCTYNCSSHF